MSDTGTMIGATALRAHFARRLSDLYGREVPAYTTLLQVSREVNDQVLSRDAAAAQQFGSIDRVTAERHGAIRVGTPRELRQVTRIFAALGMYPTGFYDLRDVGSQPVPVISTAFRPHDRDELAANPFRVFTSMLVPQDRRFFDADLEQRLLRFLDARELFAPQLLALADRAVADDGLSADDAGTFMELAAAAFALSPEPVDRGWYEELQAVSGVAADIGGVGSTHINHLTPRVLDIDDLYASMQARGVQMIDQIQGPPRWSGPDVLLRQTSFKALAEPRAFRESDGRMTGGALRVRFGEVEARGVALTARGRDTYERLGAEVDRRCGKRPDVDRSQVAQDVWSNGFPVTMTGLARTDLAYFTYDVAQRPRDGTQPPASLTQLLDGGWLRPSPIVYEDFLPRSAAGIFASNLTRGMDGGETSEGDIVDGGAPRDREWLAAAIQSPISQPDSAYAREQATSLDSAAQALGLDPSLLGSRT